MEKAVEDQSETNDNNKEIIQKKKQNQDKQKEKEKYDNHYRSNMKKTAKKTCLKYPLLSLNVS